MSSTENLSLSSLIDAASKASAVVTSNLTLTSTSTPTPSSITNSSSTPTTISAATTTTTAAATIPSSNPNASNPNLSLYSKNLSNLNVLSSISNNLPTAPTTSILPKSTILDSKSPWSIDSVPPTKPKQTPFSADLLNGFDFNSTGDNYYHFITGESAMALKQVVGGNYPNDEATKLKKRAYYQQCLRVLDWSFSDKIVNDAELLPIYAGAIEDMETHLREIFMSLPIESINKLNPNRLENTTFSNTTSSSDLSIKTESSSEKSSDNSTCRYNLSSLSSPNSASASSNTTVSTPNSTASSSAPAPTTTTSSSTTPASTSSSSSVPNDPYLLLRERLSLDTLPFRFAKKNELFVHEYNKDDERRVALQALFLFILRPYLPLKYPTINHFLEKYPELKDRSTIEQERLRNTSNWMDLAFYTLQPRNNKTYILNLIPRIVEGKSARYITGSGQTRPTSDRVNIFRVEGNCEKIKRPPRKKRKDDEDELNNSYPIKHDYNSLSQFNSNAPYVQSNNSKLINPYQMKGYKVPNLMGNRLNVPQVNPATSPTAANNVIPPMNQANQQSYFPFYPLAPNNPIIQNIMSNPALVSLFALAANPNLAIQSTSSSTTTTSSDTSTPTASSTDAKESEDSKSKKSATTPTASAAPTVPVVPTVPGAAPTGFPGIDPNILAYLIQQQFAAQQLFPQTPTPVTPAKEEKPTKSKSKNADNDASNITPKKRKSSGKTVSNSDSSTVSDSSNSIDSSIGKLDLLLKAAGAME